MPTLAEPRQEDDHQPEPGEFAPDGEIEEHEARDEDDGFGREHEDGPGQHLSQVEHPPVRRHHHQPFQAAVFLLHGEHPVEPQRPREGEGDPEDPGRGRPRVDVARAEGEVEDDEDHHPEKEHGVERVLGPQLDREVLAEDGPEPGHRAPPPAGAERMAA